MWRPLVFPWTKCLEYIKYKLGMGFQIDHFKQWNLSVPDGNCEWNTNAGQLLWWFRMRTIQVWRTAISFPSWIIWIHVYIVHLIGCPHAQQRLPRAVIPITLIQRTCRQQEREVRVLVKIDAEKDERICRMIVRYHVRSMRITSQKVSYTQSRSRLVSAWWDP